MKSILFQFVLREAAASARQLWPLAATLALAIAAVTLVRGSAGLVTDSLAGQSRELVGGDLVISGSRPIAESAPDLAAEFSNLATRTSAGFQTNSIARAGADSALIQLKVIDENYPLVGQVQLVSGQAFRPLAADEILVEPGFLTRLGLRSGDTVAIGSSEFTIRDAVAREPDASFSVLQLGLRVLISESGFAATGLDRSQSRVEYRLAGVLPDSISAPELEAKWDALELPGIRIRTAEEGPRFLTRTLRLIEQFLLTAAVLSLLLAVTAAFVTLGGYLAQRTRAIALLKSLGVTSRGVTGLFFVLAGGLAIFASLAGVAAGNLAAYFALPSLAGLLSLPTVPEFQPQFVLGGVAVGLGTAAIASSLLFVRLANIRPAAVLQDRPLPARQLFASQVASGLLAAALAFGVLFLLLRNFVFSAQVLAGLAALAAALVGAVWISLRILKKFAPRIGGFALRGAVSGLLRPGALSALLIGSTSLAIAGLAATLLIRASLLGSIESQFSAAAPSLVVLDIQRSQVEAARDLVGEYGPLYPMIRARVVAVNGDPDTREMRREYSLSYGDALPAGESISRGDWWQSGTAEALVSVDAEEAAESALAVGDSLTFDIQGRQITARIASIREIPDKTAGAWFVFLFPENLLKTAPQSFFGLLDVPPDRKLSLQRELAATFPNVSIADTGDLAATLAELARQISLAVLAVSGFTAVSGLALLAATIQSSLAAQRRDLLRLRALGASRGFIWRRYLAEAALTTLLAALPGLLLAVAGVAGLNRWTFEIIQLRLDPFIFAVPVLYLAVALLLAGLWLAAGLRRPAGQLLRESR